VLTLLVADTGTITTAGNTGAVVAGGVTIGNATSSSGVWTAEGDAGSVTITATGENTATIAATDDAEFVAGTGTPTITVAAGKTLSTTASIDLGTTGSLVLTGAEADGGAKLTGAGAVKFGNASITGGANGWQAVVAGGSPKITFAVATSTATKPTITGTGTTPKLVGGDGAGAIEIAPDNTAAVNLTVTLAEIDLTDGGSVIINHAGGNGAASTLTLEDGKGDGTTLGKLTFNSNVGNNNVATPGNRAKVYQADDTEKVRFGSTNTSATGIEVKADSDGDNVAARSIAGGASDNNDAVITGQADNNAVTLDNTAKFGVT
jgi:hypothetical protein